MQALINFASGREIPSQRGAMEDSYGTIVRKIKQAAIPWTRCETQFQTAPSFSIFKVGVGSTISDGTITLQLQYADVDTILYAVNERYPIAGARGWVRLVLAGYEYWVRCSEALQTHDRVGPNDSGDGTVMKDRLGDFRVVASSYQEGAYHYASVYLDPIVSWCGYALEDMGPSQMVKIGIGNSSDKYRRCYTGFGEIQEGQLTFVGQNGLGDGSENGQSGFNAKWWAVQRPCPNDQIS